MFWGKGEDGLCEGEALDSVEEGLHCDGVCGGFGASEGDGAEVCFLPLEVAAGFCWRDKRMSRKMSFRK